MHADRFFMRRIFKIWPLFYIAFLLQLAYFITKQTPPHSSQIIAEIFFFQNYRPGFNAGELSLAIEEQFYFIIAIVLPFITHFRQSEMDSTWLYPDNDNESGFTSDSLFFFSILRPLYSPLSLTISGGFSFCGDIDLVVLSFPVREVQALGVRKESHVTHFIDYFIGPNLYFSVLR